MTRDTDLIRRGDAIAAIPNGWLGQPHCSNMDYGPNVSVQAIASIRALPAQEPPSPGVTAGATGLGGCGYPCGYDCNGACFTTPAPVVPAEGLAAAMERLQTEICCADGDRADAAQDHSDGSERVDLWPHTAEFDVDDVRMVLTALRTARPVSARVRPLEWHRIGTFGGDCYDASATGVVYRIVPKADGTFWLTAPSTTTATLEAAKAAAQADYEARILAALLPAGEGE